jgi:four helix bundle protein
MIERFEQLEVWQAAHKHVLEIYKNTQRFPVEERYGLVSQMRRAAVSVPANVAEGAAAVIRFISIISLIRRSKSCATI